MAIQSGQAAAAIEPLRVAQARWPQSRPLRLVLAQALQAAGQHAPAVAYLRDQTALYAADARLYQLLALSYEALGQRVRQHQALAEMYRLEGWLAAAVDQLETAQRLMRGVGAVPEEFILGSEINARLRELREQLLEAESALKAARERRMSLAIKVASLTAVAGGLKIQLPSI